MLQPDNLAAALHRHGLEHSPEEYADMLWLIAQGCIYFDQTKYIDQPESTQDEVVTPIPENVSKPADEPSPDKPLEKEDKIVPPINQPTLAQPGKEIEVDSDEQVDAEAKLHAPTVTNSTETHPEPEGHAFHTPGGRALPTALLLSRALRPFRTRTKSRNNFVLDEQETAQRIAQTGIWQPTLKAKSERWLEVALIIDDATSMEIWHKTADEFESLLHHLGAFRQIRKWRLMTDECCQLSWLEPPGSRSVHDLQELLQPASKKLILILSDFVSPKWQSEHLLGGLKRWGEVHTVSLVHVLPQRLWQGSRIGTAKLVRGVNQTRPASANAQWSFKASAKPWLKPIADHHPPLLLTTLEPQNLSRLANFVVGTGEAQLPAFVFRPTNKLPSQETDPNETDLGEHLKQFRSVASPTAFRLACYLAAAPLRLPIMRLIQRVMLPESNQTHLAEFFLGGLIKRLPASEGTSADDVDYEFIGDARSRLLQAGLVTDALHVLEEVSQFITSHYGYPIDFKAVLFNPEEIQPVEDNTSKHFANITAEVLQNLGGEFAKVADALRGRGVSRVNEEAALNNQETTIKTHGSFPGDQCVFDGFSFVWIPPGEFIMGSPDTEANRHADEKQHTVKIHEGFWMSQYVVSKAQFQQFVEATAYSTTAEQTDGSYIWNGAEWEKSAEASWRSVGFEQEPDHPAVCVSWLDAVAFTKWLGEKYGKHYRLPTEAEWEYAARADSENPFPTGKTINAMQANYYFVGKEGGGINQSAINQSAINRTAINRTAINRTTPVFALNRNSWGLQQMHGNVYEWTSSRYAFDYDGSEIEDYSNDIFDGLRSVRGGSWVSYKNWLRSSARNGLTLADRYSDLGFRIVMVADPKVDEEK